MTVATLPLPATTTTMTAPLPHSLTHYIIYILYFHLASTYGAVYMWQ